MINVSEFCSFNFILFYQAGLDYLRQLWSVFEGVSSSPLQD